MAMPAILGRVMSHVTSAMDGSLAAALPDS